MIDQHIEDEPCAKQRALLGIPPAVSQAFLEASDLRAQFFLYTFSTAVTAGGVLGPAYWGGICRASPRRYFLVIYQKR
jgi:hypothetical protein